jgi:hypothetical protein
MQATVNGQVSSEMLVNYVYRLYGLDADAMDVDFFSFTGQALEMGSPRLAQVCFAWMAVACKGGLDRCYNLFAISPVCFSSKAMVKCGRMGGDFAGWGGGEVVMQWLSTFSALRRKH